MTLMENVSKVVVALNSIKNAIIEKGVTPTGDCTTYAQAIAQIPSGSGVKFASGTFTATTTNIATVDCGFKPRYISITQYGTTIICEYNSDYDSTKQRIIDANGTPATLDVPSTRNLCISEITDNGFIYRGHNTSRQYYWFAVG